MSKKDLNIQSIQSELQDGASLFFRDITPRKNTPDEVKNVRSDERTSERTTVQKPVRRIIRHAFDIYADQLYALQAIQLEAVQSSRKKPKLGTMVQKALDLYLQQRQKK